MILQLYETIIAKLQTEKVKKQLQEAGFLQPLIIDFYYGQPLNPEQFEITFPAVLIDYTIDWENEMFMLQAHVVSEYEAPSDSLTINRTPGTQYVELLNIVRYALTGLKSEALSNFTPTTEQKTTTDFFHYHILSFKATVLGGIPVPSGEEKYVKVDGVTGVITGGKLVERTKKTIPIIDVF